VHVQLVGECRGSQLWVAGDQWTWLIHSLSLGRPAHTLSTFNLLPLDPAVKTNAKYPHVECRKQKILGSVEENNNVVWLINVKKLSNFAVS